MPQTRNVRAAELHNLARRKRTLRRPYRTKHNDRLTAHELSRQAMERSREAHEHSEKMAAELAGTINSKTGKGRPC